MSKGIPHTRRCVDHYRKLGLCPLPSKASERKGPMLTTFADHYGVTPVPDHVYERWATVNIQLITGTKSPTDSKILVVDCDGDEAWDVWARILELNNDDASGCWVSVTGSGNGYHTYYRIPTHMSECLTGRIWGLWNTFSGWAKHQEIRILADSALVVAPPSVHVVTGDEYQFTGLHNPATQRLPKFAPAWLLGMPRLNDPVFAREHNPLPRRLPAPRREGERYSSAEVLDAIPSKQDVAASWGVVFVGRENKKGWIKCYVPDRETPSLSNPSGSFSTVSGRCMDMLTGQTISLFDIGASIGRYSNWMDCRDALGDQYLRR